MMRRWRLGVQYNLFVNNLEIGGQKGTKCLYDEAATAIISGLDLIGLAWAGFLSAYVTRI